MTTVPRVSVVMSVFNGMPYLSEAVESILSQTFTDFEFIITDDGSRDGTWEALTTAARRDARIRLIRNPSNIGAAPARNQSMALATGDYIAGQDADDISHPERLARQVEFLDANPAVGVLGTAQTFVDEAGRPLGEMQDPVETEDEALQPLLLDMNCFCAASVMFRRSLLIRVGGYDETMAHSEDYDLLLRLAEATKIGNLLEGLYSYRQHARSSTRTHRFEQMQDKAAALQRALARRYGQTPPEPLRRLLVRDYLRAACLGFFVGEVEPAREEIAKAVQFGNEAVLAGSLVEEVFGRYVLRQQLHEPFQLVESLFEQLLPPTRGIARAKSRLVSQLHMREVFEGAARGEGGRIDRHWLAGLRLDPRWARNRGVWVIGARRAAQRYLGPLVRGLAAWFPGIAHPPAVVNRDLGDGTTRPGS